MDGLYLEPYCFEASAGLNASARSGLSEGFGSDHWVNKALSNQITVRSFEMCTGMSTYFQALQAIS